MKHRDTSRKNYTIVHNTLIRDKALTAEAKYLLIVMLMLPEDWRYSISGLKYETGLSDRKIKAAIRLLKETGYLRVTKKYPSKGCNRIEYEYEIFESPTAVSQAPQPETDKTEHDAFIFCPEKDRCEDVISEEVQNEAFQIPFTEDYTQLNNNKQNKDNKHKDDKPKKNKAASVPVHSDGLFINAFKTFSAYRKSINKPLTPKSREFILSDLSKITTDKAEQAEILEQSVKRGWTGVYPLKKPLSEAMTAESFCLAKTSGLGDIERAFMQSYAT